jgi:hypothetical protein
MGLSFVVAPVIQQFPGFTLERFHEDFAVTAFGDTVTLEDFAIEFR